MLAVTKMQRSRSNMSNFEYKRSRNLKKLFIDSNIYLGFFNSNKPEFKKLLAALVELKDDILITEQIIDEVNRNKLTVFRQSLDNYVNSVKVIKTFLPEHLDNNTSAKLKDWNEKRGKLEQNALKLNEELIEIAKQLTSEISKSTDNVSKGLLEVFEKTLKASEGNYKAARIRRETGNPPGKIDDPLGDQLNWVQILEIAEKISSLSIVTNDFDYFTEYGNQFFLNPLLFNELLHINPKIEILLFNKLSDALRDFNSKKKIESLPDNKELEAISKEEIILATGHKFYGGGHSYPTKCPNCLSVDSFIDEGYQRSKYGGLTYQYICRNCGFHYDTGDFWE